MVRDRYNIIEEYIDNKEVIECVMPMTKDLRPSQNYDNTDQIEEHLKDGKMLHSLHLGSNCLFYLYAAE